MKKIIILTAAVFYGGFSFAQAAQPSAAFIAQKIQADEKLLTDWPQLARYHDENSALASPKPNELRVVFMGDSITDFWGRREGSFFPGKPYVNRGISGQVTGQMLIRFRPDVIALKPRVVVILAGTNDIAGNRGPTTIEAVEDNLLSMTELARANHIKVVLSSITPVNDYVQPDMSKGRPAQKILDINAWIKAYAEREHLVYLDYYPALLDANHALKKELSDDGLHPNAAGYAVMAPLAQHAIDQALAQ
jgi:lysophospholipase L1-like esterase